MDRLDERLVELQYVNQEKRQGSFLGKIPKLSFFVEEEKPQSTISLLGLTPSLEKRNLQRRALTFNTSYFSFYHQIKKVRLWASTVQTFAELYSFDSKKEVKLMLIKD